MNRNLRLGVLAATLLGASALASEPEVEILRGPPRANRAKTVEISPAPESGAHARNAAPEEACADDAARASAEDARAKADAARASADDARAKLDEARAQDDQARTQRDEARAKRDADERARKQRELEELARRTQEEYRRAANALIGK